MASQKLNKNNRVENKKKLWQPMKKIGTTGKPMKKAAWNNKQKHHPSLCGQDIETWSS